MENRKYLVPNDRPRTSVCFQQEHILVHQRVHCYTPQLSASPQATLEVAYPKNICVSEKGGGPTGVVNLTVTHWTHWAGLVRP